MDSTNTNNPYVSIGLHARVKYALLEYIYKDVSADVNYTLDTIILMMLDKCKKYDQMIAKAGGKK